MESDDSIGNLCSSHLRFSRVDFQPSVFCVIRNGIGHDCLFDGLKIKYQEIKQHIALSFSSLQHPELFICLSKPLSETSQIFLHLVLSLIIKQVISVTGT